MSSVRRIEFVNIRLPVHSSVSAQQWKQAFIQFTNIQDKQISIFTSQSADMVSLL